MRQISQLLLKFKNLKPPKKAIEDEVRKIIEEKINIPSDSYRVVFKKPNITISSQNPVLKNEIFIHEENILKKIKEKFGEKTEIKIFFK